MVKRKFQVFLDRIATKFVHRWVFFLIVLSFFGYRVFSKKGFAVLTYLLGLFYLNLIMLYLAPAEDEADMQLGDFELPTRENDEYKGFARKLHEMEFWK